ncbi:hypothetical protein HMPREF0201_02438 [Cedecea davisae DSM 4568]|uniref:Uncharacterized protein n=1 Tax=Cedecea davisae DSM 4568 TaxID=566551 RepID=S3J9A7_9ENTR|nr:hypothetical protein HMPREF0201_02438 [Cedecea davisae DSM 4568]
MAAIEKPPGLFKFHTCRQFKNAVEYISLKTKTAPVYPGSG